MYNYVSELEESVGTCSIVPEKPATLYPLVPLKTAVMSPDKRKNMKVRDTLPRVKKEKCARRPFPSHLCLCLLSRMWAHMHTCTNTEAHKQNTESQCLKTKAALRNKRRPKKPSRHPQQAPIVINENKYWERVGHRRRETAQTMEQTA